MTEQLQYVVSPAASQLASGVRGRVAVVVPHLSRWFFGALLEGLEARLRQADLDVLLYRVATREDREHFFRRLPARRKVDAVVVLAFPVSEDEQERLALMGVGILAAGALEDAGVASDPQLVRTVPWGGTHGADAMAQFLSLRHPPTAVYAHSDEIAFGALATLRRAGVRVPEDISVVGIDDHPLAALADLTTVAQPVLEQGEMVGQMVIDTLAGRSVAEGRTVRTRLVVRGTTARPRGAA